MPGRRWLLAIAAGGLLIPWLASGRPGTLRAEHPDQRPGPRGDCRDCHFAAAELFVSSHADLLCTECHAPHGTTDNIFNVPELIDTPNSGPRPVVFIVQQGPNSYADGDDVYDGVCEVCHTTTDYHRNDASGDSTHFAAANCATCHDHWSGYAPADCSDRIWFLDDDDDDFGTDETTAACTKPLGYAAVPGDCNDGDPLTYPGATETNDGQDNQCPGDIGYGVVDELTGPCGFQSPEDADEFSCPPQDVAQAYELARASSPEFDSGCETSFGPDPSWTDPTVPESSGLFYYLARPSEPNEGSWGQGSSGIERTSICP